VGIARELLSEGLLRQQTGVGVFQGPNYEESGWFDLKAHEDGDWQKPLLPAFHKEQHFVRRKQNATVFEVLPHVKSSDPKKHRENMDLDLHMSRLHLETQYELKEGGLEYEGDFTHTFAYELGPPSPVMSSKEAKGALPRGEIQHLLLDEAEADTMMMMD